MAVTGGAGFIGSHLADALVALGADVTLLDDLSNGRLANLSGDAGRARLVRGSILDAAALDEALAGAELVFHQAARGSVPQSIEAPLDYLETNVSGTMRVLEACRRQRVRRVVYAASSSAYGGAPGFPKVESMRPDPLSPYAFSKLACESLLRTWWNCYGIDAVSLRYFNVFGPRQDPKSAYAAAVPIFLRQALASEPLTIFGDGGQTRDFISVHDVVAANLFAATKPGMAGVYNVGYGGEMTVLDLAQRIIRATGSRSVIQHAPTRAGDVRHSRADVTRLLASGFRPTTSVDAALAELVTSARAAQ